MRLLIVVVLFLTGCASGVWKLHEENDFFMPGGRDKNYTQGVGLSYSPDDETTFSAGQQFYTPDDLRTSERIRDDRPYAGQLWVGYDRHNVTRRHNTGAVREEAGVKVGCVGSCSLAREAQKFVHNDLGFGTDPKGWRHQIKTEPTIGVHYERQKRIVAFGNGYWSGDGLASARLDLGNDISRLTSGGLFRYGYNLPAHFGPDRIEPTEALVESSSPASVYVALGLKGYYTAYNVFIDNHLFREGTGLDLEPFGYDASAGLIFEYKGYQFGYQHVFRGKEYDGDNEHQYGVVTFGWTIAGD